MFDIIVFVNIKRVQGKMYTEYLTNARSVVIDASGEFLIF